MTQRNRMSDPRKRDANTRPARPASEAYLERAGLHYLSRFAASTEHFKSVLWRKVQRRGLPEGVGDAEARGWIDRLAVRFQELGLLDDAAYAEGRARSLHRRGRPLKVVARDLAVRGVDETVAAQAIEGLRDASEDPDIEAARAFARRRRLGPYRDGPADQDRRRKDLAALARAGFSYDVARSVLQADPDDGTW
jgi:regulatory protein